MGTVIQDMPHINHRRPPRWDRFERADLLEQYRELRTKGISERQAAKELKVPRTTLQAWRLWHDTLDICPHVAEFFQSGPGLAFLHAWSLPAILPVSKSARAAFALYVSSST